MLEIDRPTFATDQLERDATAEVLRDPAAIAKCARDDVFEELTHAQGRGNVHRFRMMKRHHCPRPRIDSARLFASDRRNTNRVVQPRRTRSPRRGGAYAYPLLGFRS